MLDITSKLQETRKEKTTSIIVTIIIITFCSAAMSFITAIFLNPLKLYGGGVTGISQLILHFIGMIKYGASGWNVYDKYIAWVNLGLLMPFNFLAWFKLSKKYAIYTMYSSIIQTVAFLFANKIDFKLFYDSATGTYNALACVISAGLISGLTNGLMLRRGATSGGFITLCQYLNIKKGMSVGFINIIVEAVIVSLSFIVSFLSDGENAQFGVALSTALFTFMVYLLENITVDTVHTSYQKIKLEVVTDHGSEIVEALLKEFPHGITISKGFGAYSKKEKEILDIVIQRHEAKYYLAIIKRIDQGAFISEIPCRNTYGKFTQIFIDK